MDKTFKTGVIITGDESGGVRAFKNMGEAAKAFHAQARQGTSIAVGYRDSLRGVTNIASEMVGELRQLALGVAAGYTVAAGFRAVLTNTIEAERSVTKINAVLRATGGISGQTSESLQAMAAELQDVTEFSDDAVMSAQAILLTFDKVGGDTFPRAIRTAADLSAIMGGDLSGSAQTLGKALQDPAEGLAALTRIGIRFDESTKDTIKALSESGRVAEAQGVILAALEGRVGGTARAMREDLGGAVSATKNAFGDLLEGQGGSVIQLKDELNSLTEVLKDPQTKEGFATITSGFINFAKWSVEAAVGIAKATQNVGEFYAQLANGNAASEAERTIRILQEMRDRSGIANAALSFIPGAVDVRYLTASNDELDRLIIAQQERYEDLTSTAVQSAERLGRAQANYARALTQYNQALVSGDSVSAAVLAPAVERTRKEMERLSFAVGDAGQASSAAAPGVTAFAGATDEAAKAVANANKSAAEQIKQLQIQLRLIESGIPIEEAGTRAQLEANGVSADKIELISQLTLRLGGLKDAESEAKKKADEARQADEDRIKSIQAANKSVAEEIATLIQVNALIEQGVDARIAEERVKLAASGADPARIAELENLRERNRLLTEGQSIAADAAKQAQEDWKRAGEEINRSISDALLRGFENGKSFAANFRDTLRNMFSTLVLRPVVSFIVEPISGLINQAVSSLATSTAASYLGGAGASAAGGAAGYTAVGIGIGSVPNLFAAGAGNAAGFFGAGVGGQATAANIGYAGGAGLLAGGIGYGVGSLLEGHSVFGQGTAEKIGAGAATGAAIGSIFPGVGTIVGGIAGGVVGALAAGITGRWKVKSQTVALSITDDLVDATVVTNLKKKRIGNDKSKTVTDESSELDQYLADQFGAVYAAVRSGAKDLGIAVGSFSFEITESIKGLEGAELDAKIAEIFGGATDALVQQVIPGIESYQATNESLLATFSRVTGQATAVDNIFKGMGLNVGRTGLELVSFSQDLIGLIGSFDQASAALQSYAAFTRTTAEQQAYAALQLDALTVSLGVNAIRSAADLRALIDPILTLGDAATAAQQAVLAALPDLVALSSAAYSSAQADADRAIAEAQRVAAEQERIAAQQQAEQEQLRAAHEAAREAAQRYRESILDVRDSLQRTLVGLRGGSVALYDTQALIARINSTTTAEGALALIGPLKEALAGQFDESVNAVEQARQAQIDAIESTRDLQITALEQQRDVVRDQIADVKRLKDQAKGLRDYVLELNTDGRFGDPQQTFIAAQANFDRLVALARGGDQEALSGLKGSASSLLDLGASTVGTYQELQKLRANVTNVFGDLADSLDALPSQESLLTSIDSQMIALNAIAQAQVSAINASSDSQITTLKAGFASQVSVLLDAVNKLEQAGNSASASQVNAITSSLAANITPLTTQATTANSNLVTGLIQTNTGVRSSIATTNSNLSTSNTTLSGIKTDTAENRFLKKLDALVLLQFETSYALGYLLAKTSNPATDVSAAVTALFNFAAAVGASGRLNVLEPPATLPSALGNVFSGGELQAFANGGVFTNSIVNSPTVAPMNLFGEAGPEAIMPLTRMPNGALGVQAQMRGDGLNMQALVEELRSVRSELQELRAANSAELRAIANYARKAEQSLSRARGPLGLYVQTAEAT